MFSVVATTYTPPKVSVTASKRVPGEKKEERVLGFSNLKYVSNQLNISWSYIGIYIYLFYFDIKNFFCCFSPCAKIGYGADC